MKDTFILLSIIIWVFSITKPEYGYFVYLLWVVAFLLMYLGWSLFFSVTSLIATSSYVFYDLSSASVFFSTVLPWSCGIAIFVVFISLVAKYAQYLGGNSRVGSGADMGGWSDGGGGGDSDC